MGVINSKKKSQGFEVASMHNINVINTSLYQEQEFHSAVREVVILALVSLILYIGSFIFLGQYTKILLTHPVIAN